MSRIQIKPFFHFCRVKVVKQSFTKMLKRNAYGIFNHCQFLINTSWLKGINNKIQVIKRRAYGFHDV
ncbi:MAG: transposase [Candidatus Atribacteria bacterium]|nr:transposase [Candidatus Atribacteria bacterium]